MRTVISCVAKVVQVVEVLLPGVEGVPVVLFGPDTVSAGGRVQLCIQCLYLGAKGVY